MSSTGMHVDTWGKIIQHIWKIHWGLAINRQALGVTSYNFQTTLIALRPLGWTQKGIPLYHTENFWLQWDSNWSFPHCRAVINSWPPNPEGMWESGGNCKGLEYKAYVQRWKAAGFFSLEETVEWLNYNLLAYRGFLYLWWGKPTTESHVARQQKPHLIYLWFFSWGLV